MTPKPNHLYACVWNNEKERTYHNFITKVTNRSIFGYCLGDNDIVYDWAHEEWDDDKGKIVDLGTIEDCPEYFL